MTQSKACAGSWCRCALPFKPVVQSSVDQHESTLRAAHTDGNSGVVAYPSNAPTVVCTASPRSNTSTSPTSTLAQAHHCSDAAQLLHNSRPLPPHAPAPAGATLRLSLPLCGGVKGGFGNLLRALGKKEVSDDKRACRDLQGRRVRDVEAAQQAAEWAAGSTERAAAAEAARREREAGKKAAREAAMQARSFRWVCRLFCVQPGFVGAVRGAVIHRAKWKG